VEQIRPDERTVDREDQAGLVGGGAQSRHDAEDRCALLRSVVHEGEGKVEPVRLLSDGDHLGAYLLEHSSASLRERLSPEARECLRRPEPLRRTTDEQHAGAGLPIRRHERRDREPVAFRGLGATGSPARAGFRASAG
jgi:hypothetical protein